MNNLQNCDDLVAAVFVSVDKSMKNGTHDAVIEYFFDQSSSVLLPPDDHQNPPNFNLEDADVTVGRIIDSSQHVNSQMENSSDPNEGMDSMFSDEFSMPVDPFEGVEIPFDLNVSSPVSLSYSHCQPQFNNSNSNSIGHAPSPTNNCIQQSSPYYLSDLHYHPFVPSQPTSPPHYCFGSTQVAPYMPDLQIQPTFDLDVSIKKPIKMNRKGAPPCPGPKSADINMNDWYVIDENGKKRRPLLHEFLRMLLNNESYSHIAKYVDKRQGVFKFYDRNKVAELWEMVKGRNTDKSKFYFIYYYLNST